MPIYEFECIGCGHHFDRLQKLTDNDPSACPECAAGEIRRRISAPTFRLAGGGWYETDFKKDGDKKRNLVDNDAGSHGGGNETSSGNAESTTNPPTAKPAAAAASSPTASADGS